MAEETRPGSQASSGASPATSGNAPAATSVSGGNPSADAVDIVRSLVRPFLAVAFTSATIVLTFKALLPATVVGTAATAISAFYFGERSALKTSSAPAASAPASAPSTESPSG